MPEEKTCTKTKEDVFATLKANGLKQGSGSYDDYEKAKKVIFKFGEWHDNYYSKLKWVTEYVRV